MGSEETLSAMKYSAILLWFNAAYQQHIGRHSEKGERFTDDDFFVYINCCDLLGPINRPTSYEKSAEDLQRGKNFSPKKLKQLISSDYDR